MSVPVVFWLCSYLVAFAVGVRIRARLFSNYTMFIGFSLIYTLFPLLVSLGIQPAYFYNNSLNFRTDLIDIHLAVTAAANLAYCGGMLLGARGRGPSRTAEPVPLAQRFTVFDDVATVLFMILAGLLILGGLQFAWGTDRGEIVNSILSQGKVVLGGIYAYFLAFYGVRRRTLFMFSLVLIATFFEGSRTELIAMTIGTLILARYDRKVSNAALLPVAALAAGFFIFIAMYRIGFQISSLQGALDSLFPLFIEGTYGSYMNLQVYDLVTTGHSAYTFFLNYLVDPVVFLVPRPLVALLGFDKDSFTIFTNWITQASPDLAEPFAPYGGFFYVAEASAALPYVGPAIVAFGFALVTSWAERSRAASMRGRFRFVVFTLGFSMFFIKHTFAASSHFYFTTFVTAYGLYALAALAGATRRPVTHVVPEPQAART